GGRGHRVVCRSTFGGALDGGRDDSSVLLDRSAHVSSCCRRICVAIMPFMAHVRVSGAADVLAVCHATVRRLVAVGSVTAGQDASGHTVVDGRSLAEYVRAEGREVSDPTGVARSARNRFVGIVTEVISDRVMSQVELQAGPHWVVSLICTES